MSDLLFASFAAQLLEDEQRKIQAAPRKETPPPPPASIEKETGTAAEQSARAREKTTTKVVAPPKEVKEVKKRPEEISPEKLEELPDIPAPLDKLVQEGRQMKNDLASIRMNIDSYIAKSGRAEKEASILKNVEDIASELRKIPQKAVNMGTEILSLFQRETKFIPTLSGDEKKEIERLTKRLAASNALISRTKQKIEKIVGEAAVKRGGEKQVSEQVQIFPKPGESKTERGGGKELFPSKEMPKASILDRIVTLKGALLSTAEASRLSSILAGVSSVLSSVYKNVKSFVQDLLGLEKDAEAMVSLLQEKAGVEPNAEPEPAPAAA